MFSLPSLAPQDSYSIWYTSSSTHNTPVEKQSPPERPNVPSHTAGPSSRRLLAANRHPLERLRRDEEYLERRKQNVQNYGSSWIKPPGVSKSLFQLREEKREMEEHQEALRREQLVQELAEAEAGDMLLQGEGMDGEMEEARDLDDDVPEAETTQIGEEEEEDEDDSDNENTELEGADQIPRGILAARLPDDVYREALVRGEEITTGFGDEGGSNIDDESQMLQEEDLVHAEAPGDEDMGMDLDADLDDDIPEADGYEHTDSDAELSSSDEDDESVNSGVLPPYQPATSMIRSDGTQNSLDLSSMLSNGSSQIGSSPRQRGGHRAR